MTPEEEFRLYAERTHLMPQDDEVIVGIIRRAIAEEREACVQYLKNEAAMWIGDETPCGAAIWKELTSAASSIEARGDA